MKENLRQIAISLITQYGDEAQTIAMLRAASQSIARRTIKSFKHQSL